jgi:hypothetical protein
LRRHCTAQSLKDFGHLQTVNPMSCDNSGLMNQPRALRAYSLTHGYRFNFT